MSPIADLHAWRQRHRDRYIARPSNAKNRCRACRVEICARAITCAACGKRRSRSRRPITNQE